MRLVKLIAAVSLVALSVATAQTVRKPAIPRHVAKSSNFSITQADDGAIFEVTTGASAVTATLPAAASLVNGFSCVVRKTDSGAGSVIANATLIGKQGDSVLIWSDGAFIYSKASFGSFDSSGNLSIAAPGNITFTPGGVGIIKNAIFVDPGTGFGSTVDATALTGNYILFLPNGNATWIKPMTVATGNQFVGVDNLGNVLTGPGLPDPTGGDGLVLGVAAGAYVLQTPTGGVGGAVQAFPGNVAVSGSTVTWTWSSAYDGWQNGSVTLPSGTNTLVVAGDFNGGHGELHVTQPASGSAGTLTMPSNTRSEAANNGGTPGQVALTATNGAEDVLTFSKGQSFFRVWARKNMTGAALAANPDLLWWKMNDLSGNSIAATVGPGATATTGLWESTGTGTSAVQCAGTASIWTSTAAVVYGTNVVSASFWHKDTAWDTNVGTQRGIFNSGTAGAANTFRAWQQNGKIYAQCVLSVTGTASGLQKSITVRNIGTSTDLLSTGVYHHIVIVYDNSTTAGDIKFYVDDVLQTASTATPLTTEVARPSGTVANFAANTVVLGSSNASWYADDLRFYTGEITTTTVDQLFTQGPK